MNPIFKDPYKTGPKNEATEGRLTCDISQEDYQFFQLILPSRRDAVFQTTFSILAKKLVTTLKSHGITTIADADTYRDFIVNLELRDGRAVEGVVQETNTRNDTRRTSCSDTGNADTPHERTDIPSTIKTGKKSRKGGRQKTY